MTRLNFDSWASTTRVALFSHYTRKLLAKLPAKLPSNWADFDARRTATSY